MMRVKLTRADRRQQSGKQALMTFAVVLFGWIFSVSLHEFAHALVAYWGGDTSVKDKGYLSLNPIRYADPSTPSRSLCCFWLRAASACPEGRSMSTTTA